MDRQDRTRVLVLVEPDLLGMLLADILDSVGDEVTNVSGHPAPMPAGPFTAAVVSALPANEGIAEVMVVLPAAGQTLGEVRTATGVFAVDMQAPLAVLDVLDRFCPRNRRRVVAAAGRGTNRPGSPAAGDGGPAITSEG